MITSSPKHTIRQRSRRGFTLIELMIAASLGAIISAGVFATFLMLVKSGVRTSNYSIMESETRRAFEQLGIDARMANDFVPHYNADGAIFAFTLTIPSNDLATQRFVTYGYDTSVAKNYQFYYVPGKVPSPTLSGRVTLVSKVRDLAFLRYDSASNLIPAAVTSSGGVKHIQVSLSVRRADEGVAATTQVIRSSAFTLRNISL